MPLLRRKSPAADRFSMYDAVHAFFQRRKYTSHQEIIEYSNIFFDRAHKKYKNSQKTHIEEVVFSFLESYGKASNQEEVFS